MDRRKFFGALFGTSITAAVAPALSHIFPEPRSFPYDLSGNIAWKPQTQYFAGDQIMISGFDLSKEHDINCFVVLEPRDGVWKVVG